MGDECLSQPPLRVTYSYMHKPINLRRGSLGSAGRDCNNKNQRRTTATRTGIKLKLYLFIPCRITLCKLAVKTTKMLLTQSLILGGVIRISVCLIYMGTTPPKINGSIKFTDQCRAGVVSVCNRIRTATAAWRNHHCCGGHYIHTFPTPTHTQSKPMPSHPRIHHM